MTKKVYIISGHKMLDNGMAYPVADFFDTKKEAREFAKKNKVIDLAKNKKGNKA